MSTTTTELIVVGAGLAGLSAAVRAAQDGVETTLVESAILGGDAVNALSTDRMLGFPTDWDLPAIAAAFCEEAAEVGVAFVDGHASRLSRCAGGRVVVRVEDADLVAGAVIIASGMRPLSLGIEGEARFHGRGISHCVACDAPLCAGKDTVVIGGGTSAMNSALYLSTMCRTVTVVHAGMTIDAPRRLISQVRTTPNIELLLETKVISVSGDGHVEEVSMRNGNVAMESKISAAGVFVEVGSRPASEPFAQFVELTDTGHIWVDQSLRTSEEGVYAAGSVRMGGIEDAACVIGDGVNAARQVERSLRLARQEDVGR